MRLTKTHIDYWLERHQQPKWFQNVEGVNPLSDVPIDRCINAHAPKQPIDAADLEMQNLLNLLRLKIKPMPLREALQQLAKPQTGTTMRPQHRPAVAKRWLNRLTKGGQP